MCFYSLAASKKVSSGLFGSRFNFPDSRFQNPESRLIQKKLETLQQTLIANPYIFAAQCHVSDNLSLKYQKFTPWGVAKIEIRKFKFGAKHSFLRENIFFKKEYDFILMNFFYKFIINTIYIRYKITFFSYYLLFFHLQFIKVL